MRTPYATVHKEERHTGVRKRVRTGSNRIGGSKLPLVCAPRFEMPACTRDTCGGAACRGEQCSPRTVEGRRSGSGADQPGGPGSAAPARLARLRLGKRRPRLRFGLSCICTCCHSKAASNVSALPTNAAARHSARW